MRNRTGGLAPVTDGLVPAQRQAVEAGQARIGVMAGPGSGKTRVLVERVRVRVLDGRLDLARTLAITFTENAAAEMKLRLAGAFEELGHEDKRRQVETAWISTIHSFCARLLRENAVEAGVDPRFSVLDEVHSGVLKSAVLDEVFEAWRERRPEEFLEFARHFKGDRYPATVLGVYDTVRRLGADPGDRDALLRPGRAFQKVLAEVRDVLRELKQRLPDGAKLALIMALTELGRIPGDPGADPAATMAAVNAARAALRQVRGAKEGRDALSHQLSPAVLDLQAAGQRETLAAVLGELHRSYGRRKRMLSALDFEDLEKLALELLRNRPAVRARLAARFDEILVDEYQDTSPVQSAVIELLAGPPGVDGAVENPLDNKVGEPRLFAVGDPFQSIYGFRNADPAAFLRMWEQAGEAQGNLELREDFRSRPEILRAVNACFETSFAGKKPPFTRLVAGSAFSEKAIPSIEVVVASAESGRVGDARVIEAQHLARRVRELVESQAVRITNTGDRGHGTPIGYGGVAFLFRSATDMNIYERALGEEGIPYFAETGRGFYQAQEVRDIVSFLRVLDNSRNEIALAAVLRSPMFGLSDEALYLLIRAARQGRPRWTRRLCDVVEAYDGVGGIDPEDGERLRGFNGVLSRLRGRAAWRSLAELIREIVRETAYDTTLLLEANGRRKVANLNKLAEVASSLERAGFGSLGEFTRAVDRFRFEEVREGEAQLDAASEGAVRLMTMHAAKGLEFPLVILPDLMRGGGRTDDLLDFNVELGLGVQVCIDEGSAPTATGTLERIRQTTVQREQDEALRVLFVAMTRAREHLILSCATKNGVDGSVAHILADWGIAGALQGMRAGEGSPATVDAGAPDQGFQVRVLRTSESLPGETLYEAPLARRERDALAEGSRLAIEADPAVAEEVDRLVRRALQPLPAGDNTDFLVATTDVLEFNACPRRYYLGRFLGHDRALRVVPEGPPRAGADDGASPEAPDIPDEERAADEFPRSELGREVHRVLAEGPEAIEHVPAALRNEAGLLADTFGHSEYGQRIEEGPLAQDVRKELPVLAAIDGRFVRGVLDLLAFENGRPVLLLDYKANQAAPSEVDGLTRHYRPQMLLYSLLVEAAFGVVPDEVVLFFLVPGIARRIELGAVALDEARALLNRFFEAQSTLSFPYVVADHCYRCAFRNNLCMPPLRAT